MAVYISSFILIYLFGFLCKHTISKSEKLKNKKTKCFLLLTWLILSLIEGLRAYSVGTDTPAYVRYFITMSGQKFEIGFCWLVQFIRFFTENPTIFLVVCALIINGLYIFGIYRISRDCYYSVFCFVTLMFYFISYNAIRQAIAISIVLNAYYYVRNKKLKEFVVLILIASCFHASAYIGLLYIPIYLYKNKVEDKETGIQRDIAEFFICCLLVFVGFYLLENQLHFMGEIFPRYASYINSKYAYVRGGIQRPLVYTVIYLCLIFLTNVSSEKRTYSLPLSIAVMFAFMNLRIGYVSRFMWYFDMVAIFAIPYIIRHLRMSGRVKKIFEIVISILLIIYMIYNLETDYMRVSEYSFFWE